MTESFSYLLNVVLKYSPIAIEILKPKKIIYYVNSAYLRRKENFMMALSEIGELSLVVVPFFWKEKILKDFPFVKDVAYDGEKIMDNIDLSNAKVDYEDFLKFGLKKKEAQKRAKEATQGIIESIKWIEDMEAVVVVLDATKNPYSQVNITIIGNLAARDIPVMIVANKVDLRKADIKKVEAAFPEYEVVGISGKTGKNMDEFYESVFELAGKA